jgi:hypothetical protein
MASGKTVVVPPGRGGKKSKNPTPIAVAVDEANACVPTVFPLARAWT